LCFYPSSLTFLKGIYLFTGVSIRHVSKSWSLSFAGANVGRKIRSSLSFEGVGQGIPRSLDKDIICFGQWCDECSYLKHSPHSVQLKIFLKAEQQGQVSK